MNSSATLVDNQRPRYLSLPPGEDDRENDFGDRAVQLADVAGLNLAPWQQFALRAMLRKRSDGLWAAPQACLLVPRQNGKSVLLEAFDLAKLFLSPPGVNGHLILHTAHLFPTAMESFKHLSKLVMESELKDDVKRLSNVRGEEGIELKNGNRLRFAARMATGSGRGFSPDDVVIDEAFKVPDGVMDALEFALSGKPNPQMIFASSTGYPDSHILASLSARGRRGTDPSLALLEWCAAPDVNLTDEAASLAAAAEANPAWVEPYGPDYRKTLGEYNSARERGTLEDWARERLGLWADLSAAQTIDLAQWAAHEDAESEPDRIEAFGVEVSLDRAFAAIGAAGPRGDGWHVEVVAEGRGVEWVVDRCVELDEKHGPSVFVVDSAGPGASLIVELQQRGLQVVVTSTSDVGKACAGFVDAVAQGSVWHGPQPSLNTAVQGAKARPIGDGLFAFGRKLSEINIAPLNAVNLALWCAMDGTHHSMAAINNVW